MKRYILVLALFAGLGLLWSCASDAEMRWKEGRWQLISQSGKTTVYLDSTMVFPELIAAYRLDSGWRVAICIIGWIRWLKPRIIPGMLHAVMR